MKNTLRNIVVASVTVGGLVPLLGQSGPAQSLSQPWQQRVVPSVFARGARTFPIVTNGYAVTFPRLSTARGADMIRVTALATQESHPVSMWVNGASALHLESVFVTPAGQILVAGEYTTQASGRERLASFALSPTDLVTKGSDGNPGFDASDIKNFVATLDLKGSALALAGLGDYTPERVCANDDGTFWSFGQVWREEFKGPQRTNYFMLRHYRRDGTLLQGYVPRSDLTNGYPPNYRITLTARRVPGQSTQSAFLECTNNSVGLYAAKLPKGAIWAEVDLSTGKLQEQVTHNPGNLSATGLVMMGHQQVFASFGTRPNATDTLSTADWISQPMGLYRLVPDGQSLSWSPVDTGPSVLSLLLGRDGSSLVHLGGRDTPRRDPTVYWTQP